MRLRHSARMQLKHRRRTGPALSEKVLAPLPFVENYF